MTIRPGDDVACINDEIMPEQYLGIRKGEIYKVRWAGSCSTYLGGDYYGVRLEGVNRGVCPEFGEEDPPFRADRFRPVVKPKMAKEMEATL